jgi:hypothetical protein
VKFYLKSLKAKDHLGYLDVDWMMLLKLILRREGGHVIA